MQGMQLQVAQQQQQSSPMNTQHHHPSAANMAALQQSQSVTSQQMGQSQHAQQQSQSQHAQQQMGVVISQQNANVSTYQVGTPMVDQIGLDQTRLHSWNRQTIDKHRKHRSPAINADGFESRTQTFFACKDRAKTKGSPFFRHYATFLIFFYRSPFQFIAETLLFASIKTPLEILSFEPHFRKV